MVYSAQKEVNSELALEILRVPLFELVDEFSLDWPINFICSSLFTLLLPTRMLDQTLQAENSTTSSWGLGLVLLSEFCKLPIGRYHGLFDQLVILKYQRLDFLSHHRLSIGLMGKMNQTRQVWAPACYIDIFISARRL